MIVVRDSGESSRGGGDWPDNTLSLILGPAGNSWEGAGDRVGESVEEL